MWESVTAFGLVEGKWRTEIIFYTILNCLDFLIECVCYFLKRDWNNFFKKNSWGDSYNHQVLWAELFAFQIHKLTSQTPVPQDGIRCSLGSGVFQEVAQAKRS